MYLPIEALGKGSFATVRNLSLIPIEKVYKVRRLMDDSILAAKYYYRDAYETSEHKKRFCVPHKYI